MIRRDLLTLLEHDNSKYPLDNKVNKEKKNGIKRALNGSTVPVNKEMTDRPIVCAAMGHENEPLDEFIEAHRTCFNDLMYFPTGNAYGLSSVAGNMEKVAALQNEFENMRNKLDDGNEKMVRFEKKVMVLTQGYELGLIFSNEGKSLWPQVEATFKQMDIAATELECFKVLQKQEQLAASNRITNLWAEVQKQKELEKTLQNRYGSLIEELEKMQNIMDQCRLQAQQEEEIEAHNHAPESIETKTDETDVQRIVKLFLTRRRMEMLKQ
ncbi:unnamed protein product [Sphenostylis stenocarpa]|uniref:Uncharacterized protein n=1 Tax=Sphenostylis stenocarpa TaxID=92480 RepID=A0AA86TRP0_9FABA|nr:unnamed protein product [Sphenostylis stenocarpa]